ncbi:MAG: nucleotidyltransferase domain-containing protein [Planctomycetota bacterium]|nr:MAG: nucleotidyltransferase domain-containing protein [Planctomycetota bacterium]
MAQARPEIAGIARRYRAKLSEMGVNVREIILFGSYARGVAHEGSDVDFIVVSDSFSGMNVRERLEVLGVAAARILEPIQALGYTQEEYSRSDSDIFLGEILNSGAVTLLSDN